MVDALLEALGKDDVHVRLEAISRFESIPPDAREPLFKKVAEDLSHEVREAAANLVILCPSMCALFLSDPDPQVRIAIVNNSVGVRSYLSDPSVVFSQLTELLRDSASEVRSALARILPQHAKLDIVDDPAAFVVANIVPLIEKLLTDLNDDVRIAASLNLKELTIQFGFDFLFEHLHGSLHHMVTDTQWRVRNNAVELLFGLALVCSQEVFDAKLFDFLLSFLRDPCCRVRRFALGALPNLAQRFGDSWLKRSLIAKLQEMAESPSFLHRETYLLAISALVNFFPVQYQSNYVFQPMIRMLKDSVHNVVLLALELLQAHRDAIHPFRRQYELKPVLDQLVESQGSPFTITERAEAFRQQC
jgi:HEAT repeat protein